MDSDNGLSAIAGGALNDRGTLVDFADNIWLGVLVLVVSAFGPSVKGSSLYTDIVDRWALAGPVSTRFNGLAVFDCGGVS